MSSTQDLYSYDQDSQSADGMYSNGYHGNMAVMPVADVKFPDMPKMMMMNSTQDITLESLLKRLKDRLETDSFSIFVSKFLFRLLIFKEVLLQALYMEKRVILLELVCIYFIGSSGLYTLQRLDFEHFMNSNEWVIILLCNI